MKQTQNEKLSEKYNIIAGYQRRKKNYHILVGLMGLIVIGLVCILMIYGNTIYSPKTIIQVLSGEDIKGATFTIKTLRLPRTLAGILCGWAFGLAGNTFQKLLGNPLASPDIIGVTSGCSVAAVFGILFLNLNRGMVSALAVICGLTVSAFIYFIAGGRGYSDARLILTGIGVQAFLHALISWMLLKASEYDVANALRWLSGSLNGVSLSDIPRLAFVVLAGSILLAGLNHYLAIIQMGEAYAVTLGIRRDVVRLLMILSSLLLIAFATSVSGPIASIAFLSGPIASKITRNGQTNMAASVLMGIILVLVADFVGQYAFTIRYPVGVITGILGAPYLLFLLIQMNRKGEQV